MRIALALICAIAPSLAAAVQVDGVDIGDSCKQLIAREHDAGMIPAFDPNQTEAQDAIVFKDTSKVGLLTEVIVTCSGTQRTVAKYHIVTWTRDEAAARSEFASVKEVLARQLGAGQNDDDLLPAARRAEFAAIRAKTYQYFELWRFGVGSDVDATVDLSLLNASSVWTVSLDVRPSQKAPPDNRIERTHER